MPDEKSQGRDADEDRGRSSSDDRGDAETLDTEVEDTVTDAEKVEQERRTKRQKLIVIVVLIVVALIAIVGGLIWWLNARHWEKTDDAYVDTKITQLAPRALGEVLGMFVSDNQPVRAGQLLVQLDDSAARAQVSQAEASRALS